MDLRIENKMIRINEKKDRYKNLKQENFNILNSYKVKSFNLVEKYRLVRVCFLKKKKTIKDVLLFYYYLGIFNQSEEITDWIIKERIRVQKE